MRRTALSGAWLAIAGLACSGSLAEPGDGGAGASAGETAGAGGATGRGGSAGRAGAGGGMAGSGGTAGDAGGRAGGAAGALGIGGGGGTVRVSYDQALPQVQFAFPIVVVDNQDTAVVVGPSAAGQMDPGPRVDWIPRQGSPRTATFPNGVTPAAIAVDPSRNLWMMGQLYRPVSFGGPTLPPVNNGYYLVRLNPDGSHGSSRAVARAGSVTVYSAAADAQGDVYVVGEVYTAGAPVIDSVFVTKFSPAGDEIYNREFACQGTNAYATDVAVAPGGDVFIVGSYGYPLQIGATSLLLPAGSIGSGFVAALDPATGAPRWAMRFGGTVFDVGNSISVTSTGALRVGGLLSGLADVGGKAVQADPAGSPFVAELTASGSGTWVATINGAGIVFETDTNAADHTFAVGYVKDTDTTHQTFVADFADVPDGIGTFPLLTTVGADSNGALFVAADRHGGAWVTGEFEGSVDFGLGPLDAGGATTFGNFLVHLEP